MGNEVETPEIRLAGPPQVRHLLFEELICLPRDFHVRDLPGRTFSIFMAIQSLARGGRKSVFASKGQLWRYAGHCNVARWLKALEEAGHITVRAHINGVWAIDITNPPPTKELYEQDPDRFYYLPDIH
jgi:hypothetical protein